MRKHPDTFCLILLILKSRATWSAFSPQISRHFAQRRLYPQQFTRIDVLPALNSLSPHVTHIKQVTPLEMAKDWLPWVHIVIDNLRRFLLGTYHGTGHKYLRGYLNAFAYRLTDGFGSQKSLTES